jgi:hypothetical protein
MPKINSVSTFVFEIKSKFKIEFLLLKEAFFIFHAN